MAKDNKNAKDETRMSNAPSSFVLRQRKARSAIDTTPSPKLYWRIVKITPTISPLIRRRWAAFVSFGGLA
jgi:hypothetical protein